MKRAFLVLFPIAAAVLASGVGGVSSWQSFGGVQGETPEVTLLESDQSHMLLEISIPGFWLYEKPAEGSIWNTVEIPGCYPQGRVGMPELPSVTELFALPFGTEAVTTVEEINTTVYSNLDIIPRQTPEIDMDHAPYPFVINQDSYNSDASFPLNWAIVDNRGIWSGLNMARLVVTPFSYNPSTRDLEVVRSIVVRVDFQGTANSLADPVNPAMVPAMENTVLNWDVFEAEANPMDGSRDVGVEYVFVCTTDNVDWVADLFELHHYLGLHTRVETLTSPATTGEIKTAITDNYDTGVTRFACIVGTHSELPSYTWSGYLGDYWYGCIDGDDYPDLAVGRITGNQTQIEHQVDKIIDGYMNYGFDDLNTTGIIPSLSVLAAHQEQYPNKYTACCNQIAAYSYSLINFTFTKVYPPEGGTAADVSNAINEGNGFVTYRGHGDVTYWAWSPGWNATNINALTNTFMPPVFNIACLCGLYSTTTTCLAEAWQWATCGSSGNLAATDPSYTEANHTYIKEIYKEIFDSGVFRVVEGINAATVTTIGSHGTYGLANAKMYIWFGDPAMDIWTFDTAGEPGSLEISPPAEILPGTQDIEITVTDGGTPVEGVNVTLTDGVDNYDAMTCYEEGTTNASGVATINVTVPSTGTMYIGAFKHDYMYDIKWVVIGTGIAGSEGPAPVLSLDRPYPNPVVETASLAFTVASSGHIDISVYDVSGRMVETILSDAVEAGNHSLQWAPGAEIASGVYFIRLSTDDGILTQQAMVIR